MTSNSPNAYPENYILLGNPTICSRQADTIISEFKTTHPWAFEGNEDSFPFELRYAAPFDKGFAELKRLQGTAAQVAGRRSDFKGFIVMDLSTWLTHHEEEYFYKTLLFLIDMSDIWKYIFLVNNQNAKAAKELTGKILTLFFRDQISCRVKEISGEYSYKEYVNSICRRQYVLCSPPIKEVVHALLCQGFSESVASALLDELSCCSGKRINMATLSSYISEGKTVIRYMLTQKEYDKFMYILTQGKEKWYGEKESV